MSAGWEAQVRKLCETNKRKDKINNIEYIEKLDLKHNEWLLKKDNMILLDGNENFRDNKDIFNEYLEQIKSILE